jgi:hypothetical protein
MFAIYNSPLLRLFSQTFPAIDIDIFSIQNGLVYVKRASNLYLTHQTTFPALNGLRILTPTLATAFCLGFFCI